MQVFKFGCASINTAAIVKSHLDDPLVVIVSTMGKSTNALEQILSNFRAGKPIDHLVTSFEKYHKEICQICLIAITKFFVTYQIIFQN